MNSTSEQGHGEDFENEVIFSLTGKTKKDYEKLIPNGYTSQLDIHKGILGVEFNGSVKTTGSDSVGCGSILDRHTECKELDFTFIIGKWKQVGKNKTYREIYEFYYNPSYYDLFWSGIQYDTLEEFVKYVADIPKTAEAGKANRQLWKDKRTKIYKDEGQGLMAIDGKVSGYGVKHPKSGNRRVQRSFKISEAIEAGSPYKLYTDVYRDICLPYIQESASRTFNNGKR